MAFNNNFVVVLVCDGQILREIDGDTVVIPFGKEYSIRLKNKDSRKAVASIEVDGRNATEFGSIIVEPNSTVDLEGFMDKAGKVSHKFKFIKMIDEIKKHRGIKIDDGLIRVSFRFEKKEVETPVIKPIYYGYPKYPWGWPPDRPVKSPDITWDSSISCSTGEVKTKGRLCSSHAANGILDDGITVEGSRTNQSFVYGHVKPLEETEHVITLQIKGVGPQTKKEVTAPVTVRTKIKCKYCGKENKSTHNFCGRCGAAII